MINIINKLFQNTIISITETIICCVIFYAAYTYMEEYTYFILIFVFYITLFASKRGLIRRKITIKRKKHLNEAPSLSLDYALITSLFLLLNLYGDISEHDLNLMICNFPILKFSITSVLYGPTIGFMGWMSDRSLIRLLALYVSNAAMALFLVFMLQWAAMDLPKSAFAASGFSFLLGWLIIGYGRQIAALLSRKLPRP